MTILFAFGEWLIGTQGRAILVWADGAWTAASVWACVAAVRTAKMAESAHRRRAWSCFAIGFGAWAAGMLAWDYDELVRGITTPFPALSDVGFLALVPFFTAGLFFYGSGGATRSLTLKQLGDLGTLLSALVFVAAIVYSHPVASWEVPREGLAIAAGNAVAHLAAVAFCLLTYFQRRWGDERRVLRALLAGIGVKAATTTAYGYSLLMDTFETGHLLDPFWVLTFGLFVLAAHEERWAREEPIPQVHAEVSLLDTFVPATAIVVATATGYVYRDLFSPSVATIAFASSFAFALSIGLRAYAIRRLERALQERLRATDRQLVRAQKMEALGTLAGGIAHDFNNMLTGMRAAATLLRRATVDDARSKGQLDLLDQSLDQVTALSQRLLTLSREEEATMVAARPAEIVRRAVRLLRGTLPETIVVKEEVADAELETIASPALLEQALLNLGINAGHAMPKGGALTVATWMRGERRPEIVFEVRDEGVGIPKEELERIFDPFFTTREAGEGTGLGLAMVDAAAREHQGEVEVDSIEGEGSAFRIVFPHREPAVSAEETLELSLALPGGDETLLVVDDQDAPLIGVKTILQDAGYDVRLAWSGEQALESFDTGADPELVITDAVMPGMGGVELLQALRERGLEVPVILMTGYEDAAFASHDFAAILKKPFTPEELATRVRSILDRRGEIGRAV